MQRFTQVFFFDFVLIVFFVHEHIQWVGEIRKSHRLFVENNDVELVIAAEHVFQRRVRQEIFHLPFVGKARAARTIDIRTQYDKRLAVNHDDVANTNFFCRFHSECT